MPEVMIGPILVAVGLVVGIVAFLMAVARVMRFIRKVPPNEALLVYGVRCRNKVMITRRVKVPKEGGGTETTIEEVETWINFRIVKGGMAIVLPVVHQVSRLSLDLMMIEVKVEKVLSSNAVPITVDGVAQIKIGSDISYIVTAAEQHLGKPMEKIGDQAMETLQGHLRAIVGLMTVEQVYKDREAFAQKVLEVAVDDLAGMGLEIVSFTIKEISDEQHYLDNLGAPEIARVAQEARVAKAEADRVATLKEQDVNKNKAEYEKKTNVAKAQFDAEVASQRAVAERANAISLAEQEKQLEARRAEAAEVAANRRNMELESEVRRPADAQRYRIEQEAQATRFKAEQEAEAERLRGFATADVTQATGEAEGEASKAKGLAGAEVNRATLLAEATGTEAKLLAEAKGKEELAQSLNAYGPGALRQVLGIALLEGIPSVAESFGKALANIDQVRLIDLGGGNGAEGKGTTLERYMDILPQTLFKFLQGATGLLATPIDELVAGVVLEAARKRGIEVTPEKEEEIKKEAAAVATKIEQLAEEAPVSPAEEKKPEPEPQAGEPRPKVRRRRLTKRQEGEQEQKE